MARINLLPWREELRKQRQKDFVSAAVAAAAFMALIIVVVHLHIAGLIDAQDGRNAFLKHHIREVEAKIKEIEDLEKQKEQLVARMQVIERLQRHRPEVVHVFDEIVRSVPDGLHLLSLKQQDNTLVIEGRAQSNARVSAFMRSLDASPWFKNPVLDVIKVSDNKGSRTRTFTLRVQQSMGQEEGGAKK